MPQNLNSNGVQPTPNCPCNKSLHKDILSENTQSPCELGLLTGEQLAKYYKETGEQLAKYYKEAGEQLAKNFKEWVEIRLNTQKSYLETQSFCSKKLKKQKEQIEIEEHQKKFYQT